MSEQTGPQEWLPAPVPPPLAGALWGEGEGQPTACTNTKHCCAAAKYIKIRVTLPTLSGNHASQPHAPLRHLHFLKATMTASTTASKRHPSSLRHTTSMNKHQHSYAGRRRDRNGLHADMQGMHQIGCWPPTFIFTMHSSVVLTTGTLWQQTK